MKRNATAIWQGTGKEGKGTLTTQSKAIENAAYSSPSRFENAAGTNPEELIAAAHAGCFSMKLAYVLTAAGFVPDNIETTCEITLDNGTISDSKLTVKASVPSISKEAFDTAVEDAKQNCPVSKLLTNGLNISAEAMLG